jgi:Fe-S oxidoreductase
VLTLVERIVFLAILVVFGGLAAAGFYSIFRIVRSARKAPQLKDVPRRLVTALIDVGLQRPIFRSRPILSIFHAFIFFGFSFYLLVNVTDVLEGFVPGFKLAHGGRALATLSPALASVGGLANAFNLVADVLSVLALVGMLVFLVRRFVVKDRRLTFNDSVLLQPQVAQGWVQRDSAIVGAFILIHVGSRFLGQALRLAEQGQADPFMPFASLTANLLRGLPATATNLGIHITWWTALGLILVFFPYLVRSKHIHLMIAPLNWGLAKQNPRGQLDPAVPHGDTGDTLPGAKTLQDLAWPRLLDAYACIMCHRCQDVCPAHKSGTALSPAALEINKRYLINQDFFSLARGNGAARSPKPLLDHVISPEAVWACTTCYACVRVCPVGNEPMADIVDIRRRMVYDGDEIDAGIQAALESLGKNGNWFGKGARARAAWTKELDFEIKDVTQEAAEYLWFVGDTASFDARVLPLTQAVARVLHYAGVDYGLLYKEERNSGNDVRRVGEEGLFEQLVEDNLKAFGKSQFNQIVTTDPHSLNALRSEYPQYGGMWRVHHYTHLILELVEAGRLELKHKLPQYRATYHDPCYLGRYNGGYEAPRRLLELMGVGFIEMPRHKENSYCCGAGGGQIWMSTTREGERPAENRIREALSTLTLSGGRIDGGGSGQKLLFVVACPKDVVMYTDAVKTTGNEDKIEVRDIIQLVEESLGGPHVEPRPLSEFIPAPAPV